MNEDMLKLDEAGGIYFTKQLEYVKAKVLEEVLKPLTYAQFIPVNTEMPLGASNFTWRSYKAFGLARYISDYGKDIPRVGLGATENTITPKTIATSYGYTVMDIRRAQYAGVDLDTRLAKTARRTIEELINKSAWNGDATYNVQGLLNYPGTATYSVPGADANAKKWVNKTADQIIDDLNGVVASVDVATNGIEQVSIVLIPQAQMTLIRNKRSASASDLTVYEFWTRNNPGIALEVCRELKGAGSGGADKIIAYTRSSDKLEFILPSALEQHEPQKDFLEYVIPMTAVLCGVVAYAPLSICLAEGV